MSGYGEFSEFECRKFAMKFSKDENYVEAGAVGSIEESMNTKTVTKKYMGIEKKTRTRGTGTGELKLSLHMNYENLPAQWKLLMRMKTLSIKLILNVS